MNEVIQINIANYIIVIDKNAYDTLHSYLLKIKTYFLENEESGQEIYSDIENRVAEILLSKLKDNKRKASINLQDVHHLIEIMGALSDLGIKDEAPPKDKKDKKIPTQKKLLRSISNRKLAGVASGIADYFVIDPIWIRLLFVVTTFWAGTGLILYIILSIVLPVNTEEHTRYKKLFRLTHKRLVGGVCTGLAAYFAVPLSVVRLIFVLPMILGFFDITIPLIAVNGLMVFIIYCIFWSVVPLATTSSDVLKAKGATINLDSIRTQIKQDSVMWHTVLDNILLIFIRIIKIVFILLGSIFAFALVIAAVGLLIAGLSFQELSSFIILSDWMINMIFTTGIVILILPVVIVSTWVISSIVKTKVSLWFMGIMWLSWFVSLVLFVVLGLQVGSNFSKQFEAKEEYQLSDQYDKYHLNILPSMLLMTEEKTLWSFGEDADRLRYNKDSLLIDNVHFTVKPTNGDDYYISVTYKATGATRNQAQQYVRAIKKPFEVKSDTIFITPSAFYTKDITYQFQFVDCVLYVPIGKSIITDGNTDLLCNENLSPQTAYTSRGDYFAKRPFIVE